MGLVLDATISTTMPLESLVVSRDPQVLGILQQAMEKFAIKVEICEGASSGAEILASEKFDAVVVDCDDLRGGLDMLDGMRKGQTNKTTIKFAILNGVTTTQKAFELGANFVMQKPISMLNSMRCFTAALNLNRTRASPLLPFSAGDSSPADLRREPGIEGHHLQFERGRHGHHFPE